MEGGGQGDWGGGDGEGGCIVANHPAFLPCQNFKNAKIGDCLAE